MSSRAALRLLIICLAAAMPNASALGGEIDFTNVKPKKDAFKDLPGVKTPKSVTNLKTDSPCTSEIRNQRWEPGPSMPVRVWTCRKGDMVFESTRPPMTGEWQTYQDRLDQ